MNKNSNLRYLGIFVGIAGLTFAGASCREGNLTEDFDTQQTRDFSGIAEIADIAGVQPIELHERSTWGNALSADALSYPTATEQERKLFEFEPGFSFEPGLGGSDGTPLQFFSTPHSDAEGVGPRFNQRMCLGCHQSSEENRDNLAAGATVSAPGMINTVNTPVSRANRKGLTNHSKISKAYGNPPTAAFTLYGDYGPSSGAFFGLEAAGGPLLHVQAVGDCAINEIPPGSFDPVTQGPPDPVTGLTPTGTRRAVGERGAPPYVARGAIEAIYFADILANEDANDTFRGNSTLLPSPDPAICPGDCVSGRHNENQASASFTGGDPLVRLGRFGVRGTGPSMLQFDIGGTQGEIGLTSPFSPVEQPMYNNPNKQCDFVADPEIKADTVLGLRDLLRNIAPPRQANELYEDPPVSQVAIDVQEGAKLFGVDLAAFRSRMTPGAQPVNLGNFDADHGIAVDRQLGCVSCHTPIMRTGKSPAKIGGEHLTNRWLPIFSDLLIHKNPDLPFPALQFQPQHRPPGNINRDLGDFAIPPSVTGLANGTEFRTPPLMGLGKVGPPFFHDSRVYVNILGTGNYPGDPPNPPASTVFTSKDGGTNVLKDITNFDLAILAAIELHDLPAPPADPATGVPDYKMCRVTLPPFDICNRNSQYRGEARNTMEKFRALTSAQQMQVVKFLLSL